LYIWYKSIATYVQEQCDPSVLRVLMELEMSVDEAKVFACSVVDIVGGPTAAQSAFVTTIIGLSTGIFGLYVATGRKWERGLPHDANPQFPPPNTPVNPYGPHQPTNPTYGPSHNDNTYGPRSPQHGRKPHRPHTGPWGDPNSADSPDDDIT
jgi:hypothetical protein